MQRSRAYRVHFDNGRKLYHDKKFDVAIAEFKASLRSKPNFVPTHLFLAEVYFEQEQFTAAETELRRAVELEPRNAEARAGLALIFKKENNCEYAVGEYNKALALDPRFPGAHYELGVPFIAAQCSHTRLGSLL